jgi:hypothetical protein
MAFPCAIPGINLSDYSRLPRAGWPGPCAGAYVTVKINDAGAKVTVDAAIAELVGLIMRANERDGYHYRPGDTGAYNCLAAETLVMTPDGDMPIGDLAGTDARLLTRPAQGGPGRWVNARIRSYGIQPLRRIVLSRNSEQREVYATPGHRWLLDEPDRKRQERTTDQLRPGARLAHVYPQSAVSRRTRVSAVGAAHGIVYGDGSRSADEAHVVLCGEKKAGLLRYFPEPHVAVVPDIGLRVSALPRSWKTLPRMDEGASYLYGFLAGYFAADGDVRTTATARLSSADRDALEAVRIMCTRLGIGTTSVDTTKRISPYNGEVAPLHSVLLNTAHLSEDFFLIDAHRQRFLDSPRRYEPPRWRVVSVEETDREEPVFCAEVPETECFALADNLLTGNCRKIGGSNAWSNHAYGLAIDENWSTNPMVRPLRTDKPEWEIRRWNRYGFAWGGHYSPPTANDSMHMEAMGTPAQMGAATILARAELGGGGGGVVPVAPGAPTADPKDEILTLGDSGPAVKVLQETLNRWYPKLAPLDTDGDFGPATADRVKTLQAAANLSPVDGEVGPATRAVLGLNVPSFYDNPPPAPPAPPEPPGVKGEIQVVYEKVPGLKDAFGAPTTAELATPDGRGRYNHFANDASIYWAPETGAFGIMGAIRDAWETSGWEKGPLGFPTSNEFSVVCFDRAGNPMAWQQSNFEHGHITFTNATGAKVYT